MANAFDELLERIEEPEWREVLTQAAQKYPDLKNNQLRQAEFSRKLNELDGKAKYAEAWETWKTNNWDESLKMTKAEAEAQQRIREIEAENETLRQLQGDGDVTFEQLNEQVEKMVAAKTKGVLTEQQFQERYGKKLFDKDVYDKEINERMLGLTAGRDNMYLELYQLGFKHKDEFGEVLNPNDVIKYANDNRIQDLAKAHEMMVSPRRTERQNEDIKLKLAEAEKRGEAKGRQESAMGQTGRMPSDGGAPEMSHLQERILRGQRKEETAAIPDEVKMDGSGKLGHAVADLYRKNKAGEAAA